VNNPNHILKELETLSPTLAAIPRVNVFSVPEGYFDSLPGLLMLQTVENVSIAKRSVPEGYFESLADNIMGRIKAESNIEENSNIILSGIGNKNVFTVPEGYFELLPAQLMAMVKVESVMEETSFISPLVAGVGNKNVFTVPVGYFENLIINRIEAQPVAKIIRMNPRRNILRYAAAAVVTGFMAFSAYFLINNNKNVQLSAETAQFVKEGEVILKTNSFEKEMSSVSDADIVAYLESKGQDVDAALVASLTDDDKALPESTDYLIDETTLDKMLNELELN
jgi:hypothetical protein